MAFEQNPEFRDGKIKSRRSLREWLIKNERILFTITYILLAIGLVLSVRVLGVSFFSGESGGLDGCIANTASGPVTGTVQAENIQRPISADGCFFFAKLSSGNHQLTIKLSDGSIIKQSVEIVSGQAVGLGTIPLP